MKSTSWRKVVWLAALCALLALACVPAAPALAAVEGRWDVRFTGVIDTVPAKSGDAWVIAGITVNTDSQTHVLPPLVKPEAGMWADVTASHGISPTLLASKITVLAPVVRLKGPVESMPASGTVGTWMIAGQSISVTAETRISDRAPIAVDTWVEIMALEKSGGLEALTIRASEVLPNQLVEVRGAIKSFDNTSWNLSSVPLKIDASTVISGTPKIGLIATAMADLQTDKTLLAKQIHVDYTERQAEARQTVEMTGTIEALPPFYHSFGVWVVNGQMVVVTPNTTIDRTAGSVTVGAEVKVAGYQLNDNKIWATKITVISSPGPGGTPVRILGKIDALPATGILGTWQVAGQEVKVTDKTRIEGGTPRVGSLAFVTGVRETGNVVTANYILVMPRAGRPEPPSQSGQ